MIPHLKNYVRIGTLCLLLNTGFTPIAYAADEEAFLRLTIAEQRTAIVQHSPEQQIELYLSAMLAEHPPDVALADTLARQGADLAPFLIQRLGEEEREIAKMHLIDVFLRMQQLGVHSVGSDMETMAVLEREAAAMQDPQWKDMSQELLESIRANGRYDPSAR
jgi:hypothetical protein